jgi:hypothetical protein
MIQEFLTNESQKFDEQITNLIHHEYMKNSFFSLEDSCKDLSIYL